MKNIVIILVMSSSLLISCVTTKDSVSVDFRTPQQQTTDELFFPNINDPEWTSVNVYDQNKNTVLILLNSVHTSYDLNHIYYYINIQTPQGFNNLTAEHINCHNQTYQILATGDIDNKIWNFQKDSKPKSINDGITSSYSARTTIYEDFCHSVFPKNKQQLKIRLQN